MFGFSKHEWYFRLSPVVSVVLIKKLPRCISDIERSMIILRVRSQIWVNRLNSSAEKGNGWQNKRGRTRSEAEAGKTRHFARA